MNMQLGIDVLKEGKFRKLSNKRVALLTNISATNSQLIPTYFLFNENKRVNLEVVFAPEHGLFSTFQDQVYVKNFWQGSIKVLSIYDKQIILPSQFLKKFDVLVVDLFDIGTRYYTFVWSTILLLRQLARLNKKIIILDRPNPLNGLTVQGPILEKDFQSFVGLYPLPVRHGLTIGEICSMINIEEKIGANLEIIKMQGWKRNLYFPDCGLKWTVPSPNMPTFETALVYPGMCLLEGTNVSEGRGTTRPFEIFGAPWIDEEELVKELKERNIQGAEFRPLKFIPTFHKYCGKICGGAQIYVNDLKIFDPVCVGLEIIATIKELYPKKFAWRKPPYEFEKKKMPFDILIGNSWIRKAIEKGKSVDSMKKRWEKDLKDFIKKRERHLLYD